MHIKKLDHINLRTNQLDTMIEWYATVLGLKTGKRPNFPFPGAWLYAGYTAVIHLVGIDTSNAVGSEVELKLEHFALSASGLKDFEAELQSTGEKYRRSDLIDFNLVQINLWDPDGNHLHIDFPADE